MAKNTGAMNAYKMYLDIIVDYREGPIIIYVRGYDAMYKMQIEAGKMVDSALSNPIRGMCPFTNREGSTTYIKMNTIKEIRMRIERTTPRKPQDRKGK